MPAGRRVHEVGVAGPVRRLDLDFGLGGVGGIGRAGERERDARAQGETPELAAREAAGPERVLHHVIEGIVVTHRRSPAVGSAAS